MWKKKGAVDIIFLFWGFGMIVRGGRRGGGGGAVPPSSTENWDGYSYYSTPKYFFMCKKVTGKKKR